MDLSKVMAVGKHKRKVRVGRGSGSGLGKTSGRGFNGAASKAGFSGLLHREGGQMPLIRRVPKRGFTNPFKVDAQVVNLRDLGPFAGGDVTAELLVGKGLVAHVDKPIKLLGDGEAPKGLVVKGLRMSAAAKSKIEAAGGKVEA